MLTSRIRELAAAAFLFFSAGAQADPIGKIAQQSAGTAEIQRGSSMVAMAQGSDVEMDDVVRTGSASARVQFNDQSSLSISEQSVVQIDKFVYNPASEQSAGSMGLRVAIGTARFVTGKIGQVQPANVGIKTPVATIGIRGTDFSMTVDEIGRTLVILLPTCAPGVTIVQNCKTGRIEVSSEEATVVLNQPFEATLVSSRESPPTPPTLLNLSETQVNNLLIVARPAEVKPSLAAGAKADADDPLGTGGMLVDALNQDLLADSSLDTALLDADLLVNELDKAQAQLDATQAAIAAVGNIVRGIDPGSGITASIAENKLQIGRQDSGLSASVVLPGSAKATLILRQGGSESTLSVNGGGGNVLSITQSQ